MTTPYTFTPQTGYFNYQLSLTPAYTTGSFDIAFFNSGLSPSTRFRHSGVSGKLFDNDDNYIHSYYAGNPLVISGNAFTGKHNIFVNGVAKNLNCSRQSGAISGVLITTDNFSSIELIIQS